MNRLRKKDEKQRSIKEQQKAERMLRKKILSQDPNLTRTVGTEDIHKRIIIYSEGEVTEVSYFKQFRLPNITVTPVGVGLGTCQLVESAHKKLQYELKKGKKFEEKWVVFDKDDYQDFENAIQLAKSKGFKVAYSNQSFEYWLLLHLKDHTGGTMHRRNYAKTINKELKQFGIPPYDPRKKIVTEELFDFLNSNNIQTGKLRVKEAYDRASNILANKVTKTEESCTTVHLLVGSIMSLE